MKSIVIVAVLFATPILGIRWQDVKCDNPILKSAQNDPTDMWEAAHASEAWIEVYANWQRYASDSISFSNYLGDFFKARPNLNCGSLNNPNCEVTINCGQGDQPNAPVNSPAGYMIINSIISLHQQYEAQYNGLQNALNYMNGEIGSFTSVFATQVDQMKSDKILADILMMVFGVVSSGTFNKWLKGAKLFKDDNLSTTKDIVNSWVAGAANIIKDSMSAIDELKVQNSMSDYLSKTVQSWVQATNMTLHRIIEEDPTILYLTIDHGRMWDLGDKPDALDITDDVRKALYTYVTPMAWQLANDGGGVFIATTEGLEGGENGCTSWNPEKKVKETFPKAERKGFDDVYCTSDGSAYYLLRMKRRPRTRQECQSPRLTEMLGCGEPNFINLPGIDKIDGKKWGGLNLDDIVSGSLEGWQANGKKNGWKSADLSNSDDLNNIREKGVRARGMVNIPVCSLEEAMNNSWPDVKTDNWPCN